VVRVVGVLALVFRHDEQISMGWRLQCITWALNGLLTVENTRQLSLDDRLIVMMYILHHEPRLFRLGYRMS
jgi:hypothetical protein